MIAADVVIIGSGAAGIAAALAAADRGLTVLLLTKSLHGGATPLAQGGLAAALGPGDDPGQHALDTLNAGAGLCDPSVVAALTEQAPRAISDLIALGAQLERRALRKEGGHTHHRVVHSGNDATGAEVHRVLLAALAASPVRVLDRFIALDLVPGGLVAGAIDVSGALTLERISAGAVIIAAGGLGQAYATTTSPVEVTGDGIALALRAGVELRDPEFIQFHPTVLHVPGAPGRRPLITEALRGAGAVLLRYNGNPLMAGQHPLGDLAPRDVVSATMAQRLSAGDPHLWLDATHLGRQVLEVGFPTVTAACRSHGVDPVVEPIPVAPGAHYYCGGIRADLDGRTSLPGLLAVGEAASTGVHGANRLASNSVTEALIAGALAGRTVTLGSPDGWDLPDWGPPGWGPPDWDPEDPGVPATGVSGRSVPVTADPAGRAALATAMSLHAGVLRTANGLSELLASLDSPSPAPAELTLAGVEAANLRAVSGLIATAALAREESRGCHRRSDAPDSYPHASHTIARLVGSRLQVTMGQPELVTS
jgi:L-aspartate oxidase